MPWGCTADRSLDADRDLIRYVPREELRNVRNGWKATLLHSRARALLSSHSTAQFYLCGAMKISFVIKLTAAAALVLAVPSGAAQRQIDPLAGRMLLVHNRERALVGVPALVWDPELARSAASYGPALAAAGRLILEKRYFVPGVFPAVSRTGSWRDVSHYTQMIWRTTTRFGCAIHSSPSWDFLICRYSPPGNADGRRVF
jgi:hypothetical protein